MSNCINDQVTSIGTKVDKVLPELKPMMICNKSHTQKIAKIVSAERGKIYIHTHLKIVVLDTFSDGFWPN